LTLYSWGTDEQSASIFCQARGEKIATYGLTEPGAGSDVVGSRSTARREGDEYVLNGERCGLASLMSPINFFSLLDG
jgi:glutaryl-CoA dehydrogenase (non-decarboxylating)